MKTNAVIYLKGVSLIFGIFVLTWFFRWSYVNAVNEEGIGISPTVQQFRVLPGKTHEGEIYLTNKKENKKDIILYPTVKQFKADSSKSGVPIFIDIESDLLDWIKFDKESYKIGYGETVSSRFVINVPEGTVAGGYYLAVIYSTSSKDNERGVSFSESLNSLLLITVAGDYLEMGIIDNFTTLRNVNLGNDVGFVVEFVNQGNVHLKPQGEITIFRSDENNAVSVIDFNESGKFILPESSRNYIDSWDTRFLWGGNYNARLDVTFRKNGEIVHNSYYTSFFVIPYWWVVLLLFIIGLIFYKRDAILDVVKFRIKNNL